MRTEIVASWERSAAHIVPEVAEAPLADFDETRNAGTFVTVAVRNALLSDPHPAAVQRYLELAPYDLDLFDSTRGRRPTTGQPHPAYD